MFKKTITAKKQALAISAVVAALAITAGSVFVSPSESNNERVLTPTLLVSAGNNTTQVVSTDGTKLSRGLNNYGQLGSNDYANHRSWASSSLDKKVVQLSSPYSHSVALTDTGEILTWGDNSYKELGSNADSSLSTPQTVTVALSFAKVSAGANFSVALDNAGSLYSWGTNDSGQLGNGGTNTVPEPTVVAFGTTFQDVKAGRNYVVALDSENKLWAWGANNHGQLGINSTANVSSPQKISEKTWSFVNTNSTSETTVAIDTEGELYVWGSNSSGQVGLGTDWRLLQQQENDRVAREIQKVKDADAARRNQLIAQCRSDRQQIIDEVVKKNEEEAAKEAAKNTPSPTPTPGATGTPAPTSTPTPTPTSTFTPAPLPTFPQTCEAQVDASFVPTDTSALVPAVIPEPDLLPDTLAPTLVREGEWSYAASGTENTFAVNSNGVMYGWGADRNGQTGLGLTDEDSHTQVPVQVSGGLRISNVDVGQNFAAAVTRNGDLVTWGSNQGNALGGPGDQVNVPTVVSEDAVSVSVGERTGYVIKTDGVLYSWGAGANGLLGNGQEGDKASVDSINQGARQVSVSANSVIGLNSNGQLIVWGSNEAKTFGKIIEDKVLTPQLVTASTAVGVAAGDRFSASVDADGKVWMWGSNVNRQSGVNGDGDATVAPVLVPLPKRIKLITAGASAMFAVDVDNNVWTWGAGNSNATEVKLGVDVVKISAGANHVVALTADGSIWNWGVTPGVVLGAIDVSAFVQVPTDIIFADLSAGGDTTVAVSTDGALYGWGSNLNQQLNQNTTDIVDVVSLIDDTHDYVKVSVSSTHALAVDDDKAVYAWGSEPYGTFGSIASQQKQPFVLPITGSEK